jgi:hypothetical protein
MARQQDIPARLDFIARRDFIYSVYSDRPEVAPTPAPDVRDHFERPLSYMIEIVRNQFLPALPARTRFFMIH